MFLFCFHQRQDNPTCDINAQSLLTRAEPSAGSELGKNSRKTRKRGLGRARGRRRQLCVPPPPQRCRPDPGQQSGAPANKGARAAAPPPFPHRRHHASVRPHAPARTRGPTTRAPGPPSGGKLPPFPLGTHLRKGGRAPPLPPRPGRRSRLRAPAGAAPPRARRPPSRSATGRRGLTSPAAAATGPLGGRRGFAPPAQPRLPRLTGARQPRRDSWRGSRRGKRAEAGSRPRRRSLPGSLRAYLKPL